MTIFGGNNCFSTFYNDVWTLSNANGLGGTPSWTQLTPTGTPPSPSGYHSAVYDPGSNRMIVFGVFNAGNISNQVWVLTNANGTGGTPAWVQLAPSGPSISAKEAHAAVYDVLSNRMTVFGGSNGLSDTNDVWVLSNANGLGGTPAWTQLSPSGTPPPVRELLAAVYDPTANRMTIFGGDGGNPFTYYNDAWVLTNANGVGTTPLYSTCLLYDPTKAVKSGATIPIKLQLCNSSGANLSSSSIFVHAINVTQVSTSISGPVEDSGNSNPDNDFRYDATLGNTGGYILNLKTTGLATGTYNLNFKAGSDPTTYQVSFQVK